MTKDDVYLEINHILKNIKQHWKWGYGLVRQRNVLLTIRVISHFQQQVSVSLYCMPITLNKSSKKIDPQQVICVSPVDLTGGAGVLRLFPQKKAGLSVNCLQR